MFFSTLLTALDRYRRERRFIRYAHTHLRPWFPYLPQRAAYNKRLRSAGTMMQRVITAIARDCPTTPTICGSPTRPPSNAVAPAKPSNDQTWPARPTTATAPAIPAVSGDPHQTITQI